MHTSSDTFIFNNNFYFLNIVHSTLQIVAFDYV